MGKSFLFLLLGLLIMGTTQVKTMECIRGVEEEKNSFSQGNGNSYLPNKGYHFTDKPYRDNKQEENKGNPTEGENNFDKEEVTSQPSSYYDPNDQKGSTINETPFLNNRFINMDMVNMRESYVFSSLLSKSFNDNSELHRNNSFLRSMSKLGVPEVLGDEEYRKVVLPLLRKSSTRKDKNSTDDQLSIFERGEEIKSLIKNSESLPVTRVERCFSEKKVKNSSEENGSEDSLLSFTSDFSEHNLLRKNSNNSWIEQELMERWGETIKKYEKHEKQFLQFVEERLAHALGKEEKGDLQTTLGAIQKIGQELIILIDNKLQQPQFKEQKKIKIEIIDWAITTLDLVEKAQFFMLGCQSDFYIEADKKELLHAMEMIDTNENNDLYFKVENALVRFLSTQLPFEKEKFYDCTKENAEFFWKEASNIQLKLESDQSLLERMETEQMKYNNEDEKNNLRKNKLLEVRSQIVIDQNLLLVVQETAFAYESLCKEAYIQMQCGSLPEMEETIHQGLVKQMVRDPKLIRAKLNEADSKLHDLLYIISDRLSDQEREKWEPKTPLDFLTTLDSLTGEEENKEIAIVNGKIVLLAPGQELLEGLSQNQQIIVISTLNALSSVLMKLYDSHAVKLFNETFKTQKQLGYFITVKELKRVFASLKKDKRYEKIHFIRPDFSAEDVVKTLKKVDANKILTYEPLAANFNPYKEELTVPTSYEEQVKQCIEKVKSLVLEFFKGKQQTKTPDARKKFLARVTHYFSEVPSQGICASSLLDFIEKEENMTWFGIHGEELRDASGVSTLSATLAFIISHSFPVLVLSPHSWIAYGAVGAGVGGTYLVTKIFWPTTEKSQ